MARIRDSKLPNKALRRPGGAGVTVYLAKPDLDAAFGAAGIPPDVYYRVIPWGKKSVIIRLSGAE